MLSRAFAALVLTSICGCATSAPSLGSEQVAAGYVEAARTRAAFELACGASELEVTPLGDATSAGPWTSDRVYGVSGCGKRAVYVARCTFSSPDGVTLTDQRCSAFLNSDEQRTDAPAP